jgi:hypothetical protein
MNQPRNIYDILNKLHHVKIMGNGKWQADCPCAGHNTPNKHFSIANGGDKALVTCFNQHTYEDVIKALGYDSLSFGTGDNTAITQKQQSQIIATYDYTDKDGKLLYQVVRYEPKDFRQRRPDVKGGWIWNLEGITPVLFHLPDMKTAVCYGDCVYIAEGEKDCLNLWGIGLVATCNSGGAGKWRPEYSEFLRSAHIIIIPDNDSPGYKHAKEIADSLYGIATSLKILKIPAPHKDFSDWLQVNLKINENWLSEWDGMVARAEVYTPDYHFPVPKQKLNTTGGLKL